MKPLDDALRSAICDAPAPSREALASAMHTAKSTSWGAWFMPVGALAFAVFAAIAVLPTTDIVVLDEIEDIDGAYFALDAHMDLLSTYEDMELDLDSFLST